MNFLKKHKMNLSFFLIGLCLGLLLMSFNIQEISVPLANGEIPIITYQDGSITSDEYYNNLKEASGISILLDIIDNKLLENKYQLTSTDIKKIEDKMNENIKLYTSYYNTSEENFLLTNGFKDKEDFLNYLLLEEKRTLYLKDYLKERISNNEVNNYYIKKLQNDFEIMYLKGTSDILGEILSKLKNGTTFEEILKNYSKKVTYENLGYISFDNQEINSDIYNDALALEENQYTSSIRSINDEYYIIFKGKVKEKENIDILRDRIINKIIDEKITNDTENLLYKEALIKLRKDKEVTFHDTYLENLYKTYQK